MTRKKQIEAAAELEYVRLTDHVDGSALPLPEGWVAETHIEPDPAVVAAKLASKRYRIVAPADSEGETPPEGEG